MDEEPTLPIAISMINDKYLLFDIQAISWLRRTVHLCGAMIGTLPQSPSQNVFLGLPVEIMPEEAQLLVDRGVGYVINDARAHDLAAMGSNSKGRNEYVQRIRRQAEQISAARAEQKNKEKKQKMMLSKKKKQQQEPKPDEDKQVPREDAPGRDQVGQDDDNLLFGTTGTTSTIKPNDAVPDTVQTNALDNAVTPTISSTFLPTPPESPQGEQVQNLPPSYPLYRHLNAKGYFMTPGLRFGCQYCVYPGDPLRFHSHFLAVGAQWDQELDLMDIVGGGRLGTGVKKGYLIGGEDPEGNVRTFSVEWAAM